MFTCLSHEIHETFDPFFAYRLVVPISQSHGCHTRGYIFRDVYIHLDIEGWVNSIVYMGDAYLNGSICADLGYC